MKIVVLFFASAREITGLSRKEYVIDYASSITIQELLVFLQKDFPGLNFERDQIKFAVNKSYSGPERILHDGDEVALIPPIAGG
jgi:molybdopterin converting factor subunit 1